MSHIRDSKLFSVLAIKHRSYAWAVKLRNSQKMKLIQFDFWRACTTHVIVESVQYHSYLDLYRWKIICINQTKQQINIWHVDGIDHIKKYESIDESPGNASLTTEWHSRSACTYIFYRIQKPLPTYNGYWNDNGHRCRIKNCFRDAAVYLATALSRVDTAAFLILRKCFPAPVQPIIRNPFRPTRWQRPRWRNTSVHQSPNPRKSSTFLPFIEYNGGDAFPVENRFLRAILRARFQNRNGDIWSVQPGFRSLDPLSWNWIFHKLQSVLTLLAEDLFRFCLNFDKNFRNLKFLVFGKS